MTELRQGGQGDDHLPDQFLVDGVAPSVIGGGPPESPFDLVEPDPEPRGRHAQNPPTRGPGHYPVDQRQEPPTSPIPVLRPQPPQEKRKSWVSKMFRPES